MRVPDGIRVERGEHTLEVEILRPSRVAGAILALVALTAAGGIAALAVGGLEAFLLATILGVATTYVVPLTLADALQRKAVTLGLRLHRGGLQIAARGEWSTAPELPWSGIRDFRLQGRRLLLEEDDGTVMALPGRLGRAERGWLHHLLEEALAAGGLPAGARLPAWMSPPPDPRVSVEVDADAATVDLPGGSVVHPAVLAALVGAAVFFLPLLWVFGALGWAWVVLAPLVAAVLVDAVTRQVEARLRLSGRALTWETRALGRSLTRRSVPLEALDLERAERSLVLHGEGTDLVWGKGQEPEILEWLAETAAAAARAREAELEAQGLGEEIARVPEAIRGLADR